MSGRLERSRTNRVISGVCGGIAEYLDIDATFVRVVMVILAFPFGIGVLIYFVLLFLMPNPGEATPFVRSAATDQTVAVDPANPVTPAAPRIVDPMVVERRRNGIGLLLVAVGVVFLLGNMGAFRFVDWHYVWPLVLIALGVYLVAQRTRQ
ncbi:MAG TPA: PspC domain-containing protein [Candidatus Limnocylindria bacterium]|jgi:phage shock protein C